MLIMMKHADYDDESNKMNKYLMYIFVSILLMIIFEMMV